MIEKFYLWGFSSGDKLVITRGRTEDEAEIHALREGGMFARGETVRHCSSLPIDAAELYSKNHHAGWLERPMLWLSKQPV